MAFNILLNPNIINSRHMAAVRKSMLFFLNF